MRPMRGNDGISAPLLCRFLSRDNSQLWWIQCVIANHATPSSSISKSHLGEFIRLALGKLNLLLALLCWRLHPSCSHPGRVSGWVASLSCLQALGALSSFSRADRSYIRRFPSSNQLVCTAGPGIIPSPKLVPSGPSQSRRSFSAVIVFLFPS